MYNENIELSELDFSRFYVMSYIASKPYSVL